MHALLIEAGTTRITPLTDADAPALAAIGNGAGIARMLVSLPKPLTTEAARLRIRASGYRERPGFRAAIREGRGALVGEIGLGPEEEPSVMFRVARDDQRRGHASRAAPAFIGEMACRLRLPSVDAEVHADNPASTGVLERAAFRLVDQRRRVRSSLRSPGQPLAYRWTATEPAP